VSTQATDSAPDRPLAANADVPQMRHCLRCRTPFLSEGFGERICRPCKGTNAWRTEIPLRRSRPRGRIGPGTD
jgi:hypothetical protein